MHLMEIRQVYQGNTVMRLKIALGGKLCYEPSSFEREILLCRLEQLTEGNTEMTILEGKNF